MTIEIPDEIVKREDYKIKDFMLDIAVMLYQNKRISLAKAASIVGLNRLEFQAVLADKGVYIHYTIEDLNKELENLKKIGL